MTGNKTNNTHHFTGLRKYLRVILWIAAAIAVDQIAKYAVVVFLKDNRPVVLIRGVFELRYLENVGAAFGLMQNMQYFLIAGALLITAAVLYIYGKIPDSAKYFPLRACAVLLCAGALANMIDRIRLGYVVDFFYFRLIDFPVFNVADCYIVISCIIFAVLILFYYKDEHDFDFLKK